MTKKYGALTGLPIKVLSFAVLAALGGCGGGGDGGNGTGGSPPAGTVQLSASGYSVAEDGAQLQVTVSRTGGSAGAASVDYATADGTALAGAHYAAASGTLTWADGDSADQTIIIAITDNNQWEANRSFSIALANPGTAALGTAAAGVTITENDVPGTIGFAAGNSYSLDETAGTKTIMLSRSGGSDGDVSVECDTTDGTATAGSDYTALTGNTVSWAHGDSADKSCTITIADDSAAEFSETFDIVLGNAQFVQLDAATTQTVTIADNDGTEVTGAVSAPGGVLARVEPGAVQRLFAALKDLLIAPARADIGSVADPVAGVTVGVYEVDAGGAIVAGPITTAATDGNGNYTLVAPADAPAAKYIVRADDGSAPIDSRITAISGLAVDPSTDATSALVTATASDLSSLTLGEVQQIQSEVEDLLPDVDTTGIGALTLSSALVTAANADEAASNVIASTVAPGEICGTVTKDLGATPIQNVHIVALDFGNWVTRAKTQSAADGSYCMNVPDGGYIVGAINRTGDLYDVGKSAGEWYTAGGGALSPFEGEEVTVASGARVAGIDLDLAAGARIVGDVRNVLAGPIEGVLVMVRRFENLVPVAWAKAKADGSFRVNVPAGDYLIDARNATVAPYASQIFASDSANDHNFNYGNKVTVTVGQTRRADFTLAGGHLLSGTVTDGAGGPAVTGMRVRVDLADGGFAARLRSNKLGRYRIWLKPDATYKLYSRGQRYDNEPSLTGDVVRDFTAPVATVTGRVMAGANPVSQAKLFLYEVDQSNPGTGNGVVFTLVGQEITDSDGTFAIYTDNDSTALGPSTSYRMPVLIDDGRAMGSEVYLGQQSVVAGTDIVAAVGSTSALGDISLSTGVVVSGTVTTDGSTPAPNQMVQFRFGGMGGNYRFVTTRTRSDGSYSLTVPPDSYQNVRAGSVNCGTTDISSGPPAGAILDVNLSTGCTLTTY